MKRGTMVALAIALAAPIAVAAAPAAPPSDAPCAGVYAAVSALSDYRFDGLSESNRAPTWQVILHCYRTDGFYAGTVLTGVNFEDTPPTRLEADFYAGRHVAIGHSDLNLEVLYASYPGKSAPGPGYSFFETQAALSRAFGKLTLGSEVGWSPDDSGDTGEAWHLKGSISYAVTPWLAVGGHVGHWWIAHGQDRTHWDLGATATWRRFSLDVRYGGTDLAPAQCYYTRWCAPGPSVGLTWKIAP